MKVVSLIAVFRALNAIGADYVVVGGLAVIAHGYQRLTHDLDLVIRLSPSNIERVLSALSKLGYRPSLPVEMMDFCDWEKRSAWIEQKNMTVFNLYSDSYPETTIDLFAAEPFDPVAEREQGLIAELEPGLAVPFASISTLIQMKTTAGRTKDQDDIEHLRLIREEAGS